MTFTCQPCRFNDLHGWQDDNHKAAFEAFVISADHYTNQKTYPERQIKIFQTLFSDICRQAIRLSELQNVKNAVAQLFFEEHFTPHFIDNTKKLGFVTAYYEPEIRVLFIKTDEFCYPIYRQPDDLKSIKPFALKP